VSRAYPEFRSRAVALVRAGKERSKLNRFLARVGHYPDDFGREGTFIKPQVRTAHLTSYGGAMERGPPYLAETNVQARWWALLTIMRTGA